MSAEPDRRGPMRCLRRGLCSLRANWELVPVVAAQSVLTTGLALAGLFMLLTALGVGVVTWLRGLGPDWPTQLAEDLAAGFEMPPALLPLVAPLLGATLCWSLSFALYCYLQGGVVGLLAEAEEAPAAAAPAETAAGGRPGWRSFRRFSLAGLDLVGRRLFWRYFWLNHVVGGVALVWMTLAVALVALAGGVAAGGDTALGVALGCVGLAPLGLSLLAVALWALVATVEVARPGTGVWAASRRALTLLRERLGAVLALVLLAVAARLVASAVVLPLEWGISLAFGDQLALWLGGRGALLVVEISIDSALIVGLVAALAALVDLRPAVAAEAAR